MDTLIKLTDIIIENRFRKDYGDMVDLCLKIRSTKGLQFNKVVVEQLEDKYYLRAGGRRFKAYEMLTAGAEEAWQGVEPAPTPKELLYYSSIPCTILTNLTDTDRLRIEFVENMGRKDFLWPEASELVKTFHFKMQDTYGKASPGKGKDGWSVRDTARELGLNSAEVVHYLALADGMVKDAKLKDIKQKSKALTKVKRSKRGEIADLLGLEDYSMDDIKVICGDSKEYLKSLEDDSFDLIVTDPPWGINFEERISETRADVYITYDKNFQITDTLEVLIHCHRLLRENCGIYMFYSSLPEKVIEGISLLKGAGFNVEQIPLIWYKKHVLAHDARETRHGLNYETILYGWKGERPLLNEAHRNVFEFQVAYQNRIHASEKPEGLLSEILQLHTQEGDNILDPFGGSCRLADAAKLTLRRCIVIEKEEELVKLANMRLRGL